MLSGVRHLVVAKGKKVLRMDLQKDELGVEELEKVMLGPSGNLRAPTVKVGKTLLVGFHEEAYGDVFG